MSKKSTQDAKKPSDVHMLKQLQWPVKIMSYDSSPVEYGTLR